MSECIVPSWKLNQQRQEVAAGEETNAIRTAHNHPLPPPPPPAAAYVVPMSNYEVATELTWENGQVAMHGLTGILPFPFPSSSQPAANKVQTFVRTGDTLESIVHQATHCKSSTPNQLHHHHQQQHRQKDDVVVTGKNADGNMGISKKKRPRTTSESDHHEYMMMKFHGNIINNNSSSSTKNFVHEDQVVANNNSSGGGGGAERERSACASASATFCRDAAATTMMTWNSFESPLKSFKTNKTTDEDSACHDGGSENRDEEDVETTKDEIYRSHSARRSRAAIVHNQSERRRRDRINEKMKALQKLVPNASKTDKASMLDEVIEYLKQLQTQVHMLSTTTRSAIPHIMINHPLAIQQQQISSLLARMGMGVGLGMGMGMLDMNTLAAAARSAPFLQQHHGLIPTAPTFVPPHFIVPSATAAAAVVHGSQPNKSPADAAAAAAGVPFSDPYSVYLAQVCQQKLSALNIKQSMNMEFYNKMAALYRQQATNQASQTTTNSSHPNFIQRE